MKTFFLLILAIDNAFDQFSEGRIPTQIIFLLLILGALIFIWDLFDRRSKTIQASSGLNEKTKVIAIRSSSELPGKRYYSEKSELVSRPDALIKEEGFMIPVDVKPLNKKIKDRHVIQLLVHMRLIEEIEGVKPPYGILLMGREQRPVRVKNTDDKQRWLDTLLDEMRSIMDGVPAVPAPSLIKCKSCDVREFCEFSAYDPKKNNRQ